MNVYVVRWFFAQLDASRSSFFDMFFKDGASFATVTDAHHNRTRTRSDVDGNQSLLRWCAHLPLLFLLIFVRPVYYCRSLI